MYINTDQALDRVYLGNGYKMYVQSITYSKLSYNIVMKVIELAMRFLHGVLFCFECIVFHGRICFVNFNKLIGYLMRGRYMT